MQGPAHRLRTGRQEQGPPQPMGDPPHPVGGMLLLHRHDLLLHQRRQLGLGRFARLPDGRFQSGPAILLVAPDPLPDADVAGANLLRHQFQVEAFLHVQLHRPEFQLRRIPGTFCPARRPPRGAFALLPLPRFLRLHGNTPFLRKCHPFSPSIWSHPLVARTKSPLKSALKCRFFVPYILICQTRSRHICLPQLTTTRGQLIKVRHMSYTVIISRKSPRMHGLQKRQPYFFVENLIQTGLPYSEIT